MSTVRGRTEVFTRCRLRLQEIFMVQLYFVYIGYYFLGTSQVTWVYYDDCTVKTYRVTLILGSQIVRNKSHQSKTISL